MRSAVHFPILQKLERKKKLFYPDSLAANFECCLDWDSQTQLNMIWKAEEEWRLYFCCAYFFSPRKHNHKSQRNLSPSIPPTHPILPHPPPLTPAAELTSIPVSSNSVALSTEAEHGASLMLVCQSWHHATSRCGSFLVAAASWLQQLPDHSCVVWF